MFEIKGRINGEEYSLKYEYGKLSGDKKGIKKALMENEKEHGVLGIPPCLKHKNYLDNEIAAYELIERFVFEEIISAKDNWPKVCPSSLVP